MEKIKHIIKILNATYYCIIVVEILTKTCKLSTVSDHVYQVLD